MSSITLTRSPGSDKSTGGGALAEQRSGSVHIQVDEIWERITDFVGLGEYTDEALRQYKVAREVAIYWARS